MQITPIDFAEAVNITLDKIEKENEWDLNTSVVTCAILDSLRERFPTYVWTLQKGRIKVEKLNL